MYLRCVIFFDELDALVPKRGGDSGSQASHALHHWHPSPSPNPNPTYLLTYSLPRPANPNPTYILTYLLTSQATERLVNQMLTEMDGLDEKKQ
eukprot:scaffold24031_cov34-Phaeocystis_antarctica.AAC.1